MLGTLIESRRQRSRSSATVFASVLVHAAGLLLVANVVRGVEQPPYEPREEPDTLWFTPTVVEKMSAERKAASATSLTEERQPRPLPSFAGTIPTEIPPPGTTVVDALDGDFPDIASELRSGSRSTGSDVRGSGDAPPPRSEFAVPDEPLRQTGGATPRYPDRLRTSGLQGRVLVRFVVDTTGRVESGSLSIISSEHELFTRAVQEALPRMRFRPARAAGRSVRSMAEQEYVFELRR